MFAAEAAPPTFGDEQFAPARRSHSDALCSWLLLRRQPARGCSNHENSVWVQLGDVSGKVMVQVAAGYVSVLHGGSSVAHLLDCAGRASLTRHKNGGKSGVRIARCQHGTHQWVHSSAIVVHGGQERGHRNSRIAAGACALQSKRSIVVVWCSGAAKLETKCFNDLRQHVFAAYKSESIDGGSRLGADALIKHRSTTTPRPKPSGRLHRAHRSCIPFRSAPGRKRSLSTYILGTQRHGWTTA